MFRKNVVGLSRASLSMNAKETATTAISANKVMVFSKSSCPFCLRTKSKLTELKIEFGLLELDQEDEGKDIQASLQEMTGQRTVPNVFVNGKHLGGCDDTMAAIASGNFQKMLA